MIQVSGRSLPVPLRVSLFIFAFELESESKGNMFHVSGHFCTIGFGVYELLIYEMPSTTWFHLLNGVLYII